MDRFRERLLEGVPLAPLHGPVQRHPGAGPQVLRHRPGQGAGHRRGDERAGAQHSHWDRPPRKTLGHGQGRVRRDRVRPVAEQEAGLHSVGHEHRPREAVGSHEHLLGNAHGEPCHDQGLEEMPIQGGREKRECVYDGVEDWVRH